MFFFLAFFFVPGNISAQDLLFKNIYCIDKTVTISTDQKTVTYKTPGQSMDLNLYTGAK